MTLSIFVFFLLNQRACVGSAAALFAICVCVSVCVCVCVRACVFVCVCHTYTHTHTHTHTHAHTHTHTLCVFRYRTALSAAVERVVGLEKLTDDGSGDHVTHMLCVYRGCVCGAYIEGVYVVRVLCV